MPVSPARLPSFLDSVRIVTEPLTRPSLVVIALVLGNFATLYMNLIAIREDDRPDLVVPALTVPLFWVMMSVAAAKGTYQLIRNPSYWEKTFHGLTQHPDAESDTEE